MHICTYDTNICIVFFFSLAHLRFSIVASWFVVWHVDIQVASFDSNSCTHWLVDLVAVVAMWFGPFLGASTSSPRPSTSKTLSYALLGPAPVKQCIATGLTCKVLDVTKDSLFYTSWFCSCSDVKTHESPRLKIATRLTILRHFTREFGKHTQLQLGRIRWNARILPGSASRNELASQTGTCMLMLGQKIGVFLL